MSSKRPTLNATSRTITGRKVKKLRREGQLPANIFGKKIKSQAITISVADFQKVFKEVGETGLVDVVNGKDTRPCLITNVQLHPVTDLPLHVDFHQVDLTEKVTANVPIEVVGEAPVVKELGAILITLHDEIEVEALPTDLPDKFIIDVSELKGLDEAVTVKDLKVDKSKVTIELAEDEPIVKVQEHKEEEIPVEAPTPAEGEAPAEGATPADTSTEAPAKAEGEAKPEGTTPAPKEENKQEK